MVRRWVGSFALVATGVSACAEVLPVSQPMSARAVSAVPAAPLPSASATAASSASNVAPGVVSTSRPLPQTASAVAPSAPPPEDDQPDADVVESGTLSDAQRAVMRAAGVCYERALRSADPPGGSLAVAVTVGVDGKVTAVELGPGYPANARSCVDERVRKVSYPADKSGGIRYYRYPINESPSDAP